jgi:hypothetical protein
MYSFMHRFIQGRTRAVKYFLEIQQSRNEALKNLNSASYVSTTPRAQGSDEPRREISFSSSTTLVEEDQEFLIGASQKQALFAFHIVSNDKVNEAYGSLEWNGMNYFVSLAILCPNSRRRQLAVVSTIPVLVSTAAACWFSATNPTPRLDCRSVQQLAFLLAWTTRALLTIFFRGYFHGRTQLTLIRLQGLVFGLAIGVFFGLSFDEWFNSCFSLESLVLESPSGLYYLISCGSDLTSCSD